MSFTFGAGFDSSTVRTKSGHFVFTGRVAGKVVAEARHRALVVVGPQSLSPDLVRAMVTPTVQTGHVNEPIAFTAKITNVGGETAVGCHFRSDLYSDLKTTFYRINPSNGARIGADNAPSDIPVGQSQSFKVKVASQSARDADYIDPEAFAACANSYNPKQLLQGSFDISASGYEQPLPSIDLQSSKPANGILNVPAAGFAYYTLRTVNRGSTQKLSVLPAYESPFDDPAGTDFTVAVCRTSPATGKCLSAYASSVDYLAAKNAVATFSVRVKAPEGFAGF